MENLPVTSKSSQLLENLIKIAKSINVDKTKYKGLLAKNDLIKFSYTCKGSSDDNNYLRNLPFLIDGNIFKNVDDIFATTELPENAKVIHYIYKMNTKKSIKNVNYTLYK